MRAEGSTASEVFLIFTTKLYSSEVFVIFTTKLYSSFVQF